MPPVEWVSPIVLSYPDQLLSEIWVRWSENVLSLSHDAIYTTPTGFQTRVGATSSNERTRAGELYNLGLLRGPLVNSRQTSHATIPQGWSLVQQNIHAHSILGYIAYVLGKTITNNTQEISRAFSVLCSIFISQSGIQYNSRLILTLSLFEYLLEKFKPESPLTNEGQWHKYLSTAMFNTLHSEVSWCQLLNSYLENETLPRIKFKTSSGPLIDVTVNELANYAREEVDISNTSPPRHAPFWVGNYRRPPLRGFYSVGAKECRSLLYTIYNIERQSIINGIPNPFGVLLNPQHEEIDVLQELTSIFSEYPEANSLWRTAMQTLAEGVAEALKYIQGVASSATPSVQSFYGYESSEGVGDETLVIQVPIAECPITPSIGDLLHIENYRYTVDGVNQTAETYEIKATKQS